MPAPILAPYVSSVVPYDLDMSGPGVHRGLPSTTLTLVLPVGEPLDVSWAHDPDSRRSGWSSVAGLHTDPAHIHHGAHQAGVQLELTPHGARMLLGVPIGALSGQIVELEDLGADLPSDLAHLPERLAEAPRRKQQLVEGCLVDALAGAGARGPRAEVGHALARLARGVTVRTVAEETGYSRRHLATLFRAECGIGPKEFQRIARFEASRDRWAAGLATGRPRLAEVAVESGYADQAHMAREWTALAGCAPTTWAREEFPFVQDPDRLQP